MGDFPAKMMRLHTQFSRRMEENTKRNASYCGAVSDTTSAVRAVVVCCCAATPSPIPTASATPPRMVPTIPTVWPAGDLDGRAGASAAAGTELASLAWPLRDESSTAGGTGPRGISLPGATDKRCAAITTPPRPAEAVRRSARGWVLQARPAGCSDPTAATATKSTCSSVHAMTAHRFNDR